MGWSNLSKPPMGQARVDRNDPLGRGLRSCCLLNERSGNVRDLAWPHWGANTGAWDHGRMGPEVVCNAEASTVNFSQGRPLSLSGLKAVSLAVWLRTTDRVNNLQPVMGVESGSVDPGVGFKDSGTGSLQGIYFTMHGTGGVDNQIHLYNISPAANTDYFVVCTWRGADAFTEAYLNGKSVGTNTGSSTGTIATVATETFRIGMGWSGTVYQTRIYNRVLTSNEVHRLHVNPLAGLTRTAIYPVSFVPAAVGGPEDTTEVSGNGRVVHTGKKSSSAVQAIGGNGTVLSSGAKASTESTEVHGNGTVSSSGHKSASGSMAVTGNGSVVSAGEGAVSGSGTMVSSGNGTTSHAGYKSSTTPHRVSGNGRTAHAGHKSASGSMAVTGNGSVVTTGTGLEAKSGSMQAAGNGGATHTGYKSISAAQLLSGNGQVAHAGTKAASAASTVSAAGRMAALGIKHVGGIMSISGGGRVVNLGSSIIYGVILQVLDETLSQPGPTAQALSQPGPTAEALTGDA